MKVFTKKEIGNIGEEYAVKYLKKHKYKVLERNYRTYYGEIDIIAESKSYLIFVEVKTRADNSAVAPSASVNKRKQMHIIKTAKSYLHNNKTEKFCRFDVCEIYVNCKNKPVKINHIKNAFEEENDYARF